MRNAQPQIRTVASAVVDLREAIGWSQRELGRRAGVSQALVSRIETGALVDLTFQTAGRLLTTMGARLVVSVDAPFLGDRREQRDPAHARMAAYVAKRLEADGYAVASEIEIGGDRSRGWIDLLACHPATRLLLVIELKTEIHDLGAVERALGWYQREAWTAARRLTWHPKTTVACLLLLATGSNDARAKANREALARSLPGRAVELARIVSLEQQASPGARYLAMVDPLSRRSTWLRPLRLDGRRSSAPYADYADFMRRLRRRAAAR